MWLSNTLEMFLRGVQPSDQVLMCDAGVLELILNELLQEGFQTSTALQSNFDLLSEIIRFNEAVVLRMLRYIDTNKAQQIFLLIQNNIIDSNVFLRSWYLTIEMIATSSSSSSSSTPPRRNPEIFQHDLVNYLAENEAQLVCALIKAIKVTEISQENISCLNTALCICMIARRQNRLDRLLQEVQQVDKTQMDTLNDMDSSSVFINFRELIHFWVTHYQRRVRDCMTLEQSSRILLHEWRSSVRDLAAYDFERVNPSRRVQ